MASLVNSIKLLPNIEEERTLPKLFCEANIIHTRQIHHKKTELQIPYKCMCKNPQKICSKPNAARSKKDYAP